MLGPGDRIPDVTLWVVAHEEPVPFREAIAGDGHALICFYPFDFSPG